MFANCDLVAQCIPGTCIDSKGSTCKAATFVPQRAVAVHSCSDALEPHLKTHMAGLLIINKGERWKNVPARRWRPPAGGL